MSVSAPPRSLHLADYLEKLPGTTFRRLYLQPSTTRAIFRLMLPRLAKTIVMRLLFIPQPILLSDFEAWFKPEAKQRRDAAVAAMKAVHMIQISMPSKDKPQEVQLTTNFGRSMRQWITLSGDHQSFGVRSSLVVPTEIDVAFLDRYSSKKLDDILQFVVSSVGYKSVGELSGPNKSVKELLIAGRLVDRRPNGSIGITQSGFTFLLQEPDAQVWTLLLLWLEAAGFETVDMLTFLFMLASMQLGWAYDTNALTEQRRNMLPSLLDIGLIYIPQHKRSMFFPTRLATALAFGRIQPRCRGAHRAVVVQKGSVVVETNYRIYAYTQSALQIAVLALFCNLSMRFPDMVAGRITRTSIRQAINFGITADQIISYLAAHAHEQMHRGASLANKPVLPPTVVDQIRLWHLENERMKTTRGFLFRDFDDHKEFLDTARFAEEIGVLEWRSDKKGMFFASKHEQIRDYLKSRKRVE
ncbi:Transcription factor Tfb2 [Moelleriella libera RCEF 2490]|uniref:RNA polymerase II transcription factor B subunit 2 n=1 Tax=Moelleriella libera RCEF 2490 TaxID=1081109 RepID=A0A168F3Q5_9HYPO|nr:Transcription factor Tfb2 [Moelleriella libera RCEF 2490]